MPVTRARVVLREMLPEGVKTTEVPPGPDAKFVTVVLVGNIVEGPGTMRKIVNFGRASIKHIAKGRPKAPLEIIKERFSICEGCDYFRQVGRTVGKCLHPKCGCRLSTNQESQRNKLAWADQDCPIGKWRAIDD